MPANLAKYKNPYSLKEEKQNDDDEKIQWYVKLTLNGYSLLTEYQFVSSFTLDHEMNFAIKDS